MAATKSKVFDDRFSKAFDIAYEREAYLLDRKDELACAWIGELKDEIKRLNKEIKQLKEEK